jgi:DNA-binding transcriptional ArsR family regulator
MNKNKINDEVITKMSQLLFIAADETRLKILLSLLDKELSVSEIQKKTGASQSLVSHQLQVLKKNNLVAFRKDGNFVYYSLDDSHVNALLQVAYDHVMEADSNEDSL